MAGLESTVDMFDLRMSEAARPLYEKVKKFIAEEIEPNTAEFFRLGEGRAERWGYGDGQLELLESMKIKAKEQGLWNFFLPDAETGEGLKNLDYAYIAMELGKNPIASECFNCAAPDTGNMEVLERVGTPEQKAQWLTPLLNGVEHANFFEARATEYSKAATKGNWNEVWDAFDGRKGAKALSMAEPANVEDGAQGGLLGVAAE